MLDFIGNEILRKAPKQELDRLYSEAMTGQKELPRLTLPREPYYSKLGAQREKAAEAFRVYKADPNTMKTVAPVTAGIMRSLNGHPFFKKNIQFNNIPLAAGLGIGALAKSAYDNQSQASESPRADEAILSKKERTKLMPLVRALSALQTGHKSLVYGGPR
jgi:hypothetical protein